MTNPVTDEMLTAGIDACLASPWFSFDIDPEGLRQSRLVENIYLAMQAAHTPTSDRISQLEAALARLRNEIVDSEDHGEEAHEDACPVCRAIVATDALLSQQGGEKP